MLPEIRAEDVTPELLRAGILRDGCLLVRGLVDRTRRWRSPTQIDRAYRRARQDRRRGSAAEGYYEEFDAQDPFEIADGARLWVREGGGLLAPDSPMLMFEMFEMFGAAGLPSWSATTSASAR